MTRNTAPAPTSAPDNAFRHAERFFKRRVHVSLDARHAFRASDVVWEPDGSATWHPPRPGPSVPQRLRRVSLLSDTSKTAVLFESAPGLVYLPDFLTPALQRDLVRTALLEAAVEPNTTSLDPHYELPKEGLWTAARRNKHLNVLRKTVTRHPCKSEQPTAEPVARVLQRLRWATVGAIYDWTRKIYLYDKPSPPVPHLVADTCRRIVAAIDWRAVFGNVPGEWDAWPDEYRAEAGLINFYHPKDSLTGHIDQAESDVTSPLVSISLGLSGIFLVGGKTKETAPLALFLESGDAVVMAGPSRQAYHGVPRVLEDSLPESLRHPDGTDWIDEGFAEYVEKTRINCNVRQVSR